MNTNNNSIVNPVVISGEAPETDSEDETQITSSPSAASKTEKIRTIHGAIILGEDSESEHEQELNEEYNVEKIRSEANRSESKNYNSLLHRKLKECNVKLKWDIELYTQNNISEASKLLQTMEQELINSQITVQGAITSLQALNSNSMKINNKVNSIVSSAFLSNIKL